MTTDPATVTLGTLLAALPSPAALRLGSRVILTAALDGKLHTGTVAALDIPPRKARAWGIEERDLRDWVLVHTCHGSLQPARVSGLEVIP